MASGTKNASNGGVSNEQTPLLRADHSDDVENRHASSGGESSTQQGDEADDEWESSEQNPRNWRSWIKWGLVVLVSYIEFLTTMPNFM